MTRRTRKCLLPVPTTRSRSLGPLLRGRGLLVVLLLARLVMADLPLQLRLRRSLLVLRRRLLLVLWRLLLRRLLVLRRSLLVPRLRTRRLLLGIEPLRLRVRGRWRDYGWIAGLTGMTRRIL